MEKDKVFDGLMNVVIEYNEEEIDKVCQAVLDSGIDANDAILNGLARGMQKVGVLYESQEYGIPEVLLCADVLNRGMEILKPHARRTSEKLNYRILIGTVEGDIHSIGKNIVKLMLEVGGFEVVDLGEDVSAERFLEELRKEPADIIALSTMMTTTLASMKKIIDEIRDSFPKVRFLVGGASVTASTAENYRTDGYGENATQAVKAARNIAAMIK